MINKHGVDFQKVKVGSRIGIRSGKTEFFAKVIQTDRVRKLVHCLAYIEKSNRHLDIPFGQVETAVRV